MLTESQILEIRRRAKSKGISDAVVNKGINEYQKAGFDVPVSSAITDTSIPQSTMSVQTPPQQPGATSQPTTPTLTPETEEQDQGFISSFIKSLVEPATNYMKFVGEAGFQAVRAFKDDSILSVGSIDSQVQELSDKSLDLIRQAKQTTNQKEKLRLLDESRKIDQQIDALGQQAGKVGDLQATKFIDPNKIEDRGEIIETGTKATAGAMSYAVPGGTSIKGAMAAGAAAGALNAVSQDDATIDSVATGAVAGGAIGGAFSVAGKALKWALKGKEKTVDKNLLTKIGNNLREDATQIRIKASVYGAKKEKLIQETLDTLGITGGPQEKYEQLQPAIESLSNKIDELISANPDVEINVSDLVNSFSTKLQSEIRSKTLTSSVAQQEVNGYLDDLIKSINPETQGSKEAISLKNLFSLKKLVNEDYGSIAGKIENNSPLTDREKIMFYGRQVLDEAVTKAMPEIKDLTVMQSHLYDAARPLAAARNTVSTFRVFGVTIPKHRVMEDALGRGLVKSGEQVDSLLTKWIDPTTGAINEGFESIPSEDKNLLLNLVSRMSVLASTSQGNGNEGADNQQYGSDGIQNDGKQNNAGDNNSQITSPNGNLPQIDSRISRVTPSPMNPFGGLSKRQVLALALSNGAKGSDLDEVAKIYDLMAADTESISSETMKIADGLRGEYLQQTKNNGFLEVTNRYKIIKSASSTPAGDISLIFGYMKMLDPTSTVREGEFENVKQAASYMDRVYGIGLKGVTGNTLNDKQRQWLKQEAATAYSKYQSSQAQIDALYHGLASKYGIDSSLIGIGTFQTAQ